MGVSASGVDPLELSQCLPDTLQSLSPVVKLTINGRTSKELDGIVELLDRRMLDPRLLKKLLRRMELTWVTFPATVILFCVGAYWLAHQTKGNDVCVNQATVIDVDVATGTRRWSLPLGAPVMSSPELADGMLYVGTDGGALHAVRLSDAPPPHRVGCRRRCVRDAELMPGVQVAAETISRSAPQQGVAIVRRWLGDAGRYGKV